MESKKQIRRPQGEPYWSEAHNRWEAAVTLLDGKRKTLASSTKGTKGEKYKEIKTKLDTLQKQIAAGVDVAKGDQTVSTYVQEWYTSYQLTVRDSTYVRREPFLLDEIISEFGGYKLKDLRSEMIQKFVTRLSKRFAPSSLKLYYGLFKRILTDAVEQGYLIASPCRGIKLPKVEEEEMKTLNREQRKAFLAYLSAHQYEEVEMKTLNREQRKAFLAWSSAHRYEALFVIALTTAMRISEIRGLHWCDVHFEKGKYGEISVRDNLVYIPREGYKEHKPKTRAGVRDIPLTELAQKKLHAHRAAQKAMYLKAGHSWDEEVLVWQQDAIGKPFADPTIRRILNTALQECGLPIIRIHDLRHTAITWWLSCRMQLVTAKKLAGHSRIEQTLKYAHALPETIQEDMILFNASVEAAS